MLLDDSPEIANRCTGPIHCARFASRLARRETNRFPTEAHHLALPDSFVNLHNLARTTLHSQHTSSNSIYSAQKPKTFPNVLCKTVRFFLNTLWSIIGAAYS